MISDDLLAPAHRTAHLPPVARPRCSPRAAGVDVLLFAARDAPGIASGLVAAVQSGELEESAARVLVRRIVALKERLATGEPLQRRLTRKRSLSRV